AFERIELQQIRIAGHKMGRAAVHLDFEELVVARIATKADSPDDANRFGQLRQAPNLFQANITGNVGIELLTHDDVEKLLQMFRRCEKNAEAQDDSHRP